MLRSTVIFSNEFAGVVSRRTEKASIASTAVHGLALEVRRERTLAIRTILERLVPIRREGTGKHGDVTEHALQGLVQDVGHLVLRSQDMSDITHSREFSPPTTSYLKVL